MNNFLNFKKAISDFLNSDAIGRTHMPFIFYNKNKKYIFFDIRYGDEWKLHVYDGKTVKRIQTPINHIHISECNSMVYYDNNLYHFTYTCNNMTKGHRQIVHATGKNLTNLNWQEPLEYEIGLINEKYVCAGYISNNGKGGKISFYNHNNESIQNCINDDNKIFDIESKYHFAKMGFISGQPDRIIVTYANQFNLVDVEGSCLIDVPNKTVQEIKIKNGDTSYKASIDPITEECYYVKRLAGFEVRNIQVAQKDEYELIETDNIVIKN